jgi:hypothetical protein
MLPRSSLHKLAATILLALPLVWSSGAHAVDILGVQAGSLDQPRMNFVVESADTGQPYDYEGIFGGKSINIFGFLDTGASGIVISDASAAELGLPRQGGVEFFDVGVGGATLFDVSQSVRVRAAPYTEQNIDNKATYQTVYNQVSGPFHVQVGPSNAVSDPLSDPLDVFGMPTMMGKVVVMDPTPLNSLSDLMHTFIYDPNTPFNPSAKDTNPGIPTTSHQVKLSYGDFGRFTETTPSTATGPVISHNPFIGPNPTLALEANPAVDNTPPVHIGFNGHETSGSFLLDTGAAASFISENLAASLNVRYREAVPGQDPQLEIFDPNHPDAPGTLIDEQFVLPIQGLGGVATVAGFYLDEMLLQTLTGSADPNDPNNIRFVGAPVLVHDVTVVDPLTDQTLTLDGIFGTNFLVASAALDFGDLSEGPFDWITFDEPNGILGLNLAHQVPEPATYALGIVGLLSLVGIRWRKHRQS